MIRTHPHRRGTRARCLPALAMVVLVAQSHRFAVADEIIIVNDSMPVAGAGTPLQAFVPNEIAAGWFTTPVTGDLVGVQILWNSLFGFNPPTLELGIHIYQGGAFPTPGPPVATIPGPVLQDTTINEFRDLDPPANQVPLSVPLIAGETFVVGLEFLNQNANNQFASSIEIDNDGCTAGANSVFVIPGAWQNACQLGVNGDFGIRAIVREVPEPGTACFAAMTIAWMGMRRREPRTRYSVRMKNEI